MFVKFGEIANALVDNSFSQGYDYNSEKKWEDEVDKVNQVVTDIVLESFQCAEDLFYHGDRADTTEDFPFGDGCRSGNDCSISQYDFPLSIDMTTNAEQPKKYVSLPRRSYRSKNRRI